jgi:hypothetical protein
MLSARTTRSAFQPTMSTAPSCLPQGEQSPVAMSLHPSLLRQHSDESLATAGAPPPTDACGFMPQFVTSPGMMDVAPEGMPISPSAPTNRVPPDVATSQLLSQQSGGLAEAAAALLVQQQAQQERALRDVQSCSRGLSHADALKQQQVLRDTHLREQAELQQLVYRQIMEELQRERALRLQMEAALESHKMGGSAGTVLDEVARSSEGAQMMAADTPTDLNSHSTGGDVSNATSSATAPSTPSRPRENEPGTSSSRCAGPSEASETPLTTTLLSDDEEEFLQLVDLDRSDQVELEGLLDMPWDWAQTPGDTYTNTESSDDYSCATDATLLSGSFSAATDHTTTGDLQENRRPPAGPKIALQGGISKKKVQTIKEPSRVYTFRCGYCSTVRRSTSTGVGDGHIRIRCPCGGKHGDKRMRMHAKWTRVDSPGTEAM